MSSKYISSPLTAQDRADRDAFIAIVKQGEKTFISVGTALREIHDRKLYRETHATFEDFCRETFHWGARRGYQMIAAVSKLEKWPKNLASAVPNEKTARALPSEPEKAVPTPLSNDPDSVNTKTVPFHSQVVANQQKNANPGSRLLLTQTTENEPEKPAQKGLNLRRDKTGYVIPPPIQALWDRSDGIHRDLTRKLREIKEALTDAYDRKDKVLSTMMPHRQGLLLAFDDLIERLRELDPYAVCFYCQGQNTKDCMACKGRGFISKFAMTMVPKELIEVRARANKAQ